MIHVFTKYARLETLKNKKRKTIFTTFIEEVIESNGKPNKLLV